jgi:hypothetical protein
MQPIFEDSCRFRDSDSRSNHTHHEDEWEKRRAWALRGTTQHNTTQKLRCPSAYKKKGTFWELNENLQKEWKLKKKKKNCFYFWNVWKIILSKNIPLGFFTRGAYCFVFLFSVLFFDGWFWWSFSWPGLCGMHFFLLFLPSFQWSFWLFFLFNRAKNSLFTSSQYRLWLDWSNPVARVSCSMWLFGWVSRCRCPRFGLFSSAMKQSYFILRKTSAWTWGGCWSSFPSCVSILPNTYYIHRWEWNCPRDSFS